MKFIEVSFRVFKGEKKVPTINLNRPPVNALSNEMQKEIIEVIQKLDKQKDAPFIILEAHHCAGIDLREFKQRLSLQSLTLDFARMFDTIASCNTPIVGLLGSSGKGKFIGAGTTLAALCTYSLVPSDAVFGYPERHFALKPSISAPYAIEKMGEKNAVYYFSNGQLFSAGEAKRLNLVSETCLSTEFPIIACERIESFLENPELLTPKAQTKEDLVPEDFVITPEVLPMVKMVEKAAELFADRSYKGREKLIEHTASELFSDASTAQAAELLRRYLEKLAANKSLARD